MDGVRNALLIVDGDYLLGGMNPSQEDDMMAFKRHITSMIASKERSFQCKFNITHRAVYFTEDLLGQLGSHHSALSTVSVAQRAKLLEDRVQSAPRQALLTSLKKEKYTVVVLNQPGGPVTSGRYRCAGTGEGVDMHISHTNTPIATPIDAAISTRIMAVVARQSALLSCDYQRWAPTAVSDVMLFGRQGYYETLFEALSGDGPLAAYTSSGPQPTVDGAMSGSFDSSHFLKVAVHMSCFEGDRVDDNLLPYLTDEVQLQIPKGVNGGLYTPIVSEKPTYNTTQQTVAPMAEKAQEAAVIPAREEPKMSTAELMKNIFDDDTPEVLVPSSVMSEVPEGLKEVRVEQNGIACPGVSTLLPIDTGIYFDQLYRRHYYVVKGADSSMQQTSWEHPLGPGHQEYVEKQVLEWWKCVQAGAIKQNTGNNLNPNVGAPCTPTGHSVSPSPAHVIAAPTVSRSPVDDKPKTEVLSSATVRPQTLRPTPTPTPAVSVEIAPVPTTVVPTTTPTAALTHAPTQSHTLPRVERVRASLPQGWDCREIRRSNGTTRIVYIDHASKATSWEGPPGWIDATL